MTEFESTIFNELVDSELADLAANDLPDRPSGLSQEEAKTHVAELTRVCSQLLEITEQLVVQIRGLIIDVTLEPTDDHFATMDKELANLVRSNSDTLRSIFLAASLDAGLFTPDELAMVLEIIENDCRRVTRTMSEIIALNKTERLG